MAALPVHEDARRYYDCDQPSFTQENAEPIALMITIAAMIFSVLLVLRRNLASRAKNPGEDYNHQLLCIAHGPRSTDDIAELKTLKQERLDLLDNVVGALNKDKVSEDAF